MMRSRWPLASAAVLLVMTLTSSPAVAADHTYKNSNGLEGTWYSGGTPSSTKNVGAVRVGEMTSWARAGSFTTYNPSGAAIQTYSRRTVKVSCAWSNKNWAGKSLPIKCYYSG